MNTIIKIDQRPPSANSFYHHNRAGIKYISSKGREFQEYVRWSLKANKVPSFGLSRISMKIDFTFKGKRKVDIDNYLKALIDSIKGYAFNDDEQIDELIVSKRYGEFDEVLIEINQKQNDT